jgi:MFS family permease
MTTGRKVVFLSALVLLASCDLLCGFSQNATMLYIFRALAGVANGGITSLSMMIVSDIVTLKERGKYQGILGACVGMGNMVGPFIAATFAQHSTWRGLFWLVSPLAAICCLICFFILPPSKDSSKLDFRTVARKIDHWGILLGSAAIVLILIPVSGGGSYFAWGSSMIISMLVIGSICALAFLFVEQKIAVLPMMPCKSPNLVITFMVVPKLISRQYLYSETHLSASYSCKTFSLALYTTHSSTISHCSSRTHDVCRRLCQLFWYCLSPLHR